MTNPEGLLYCKVSGRFRAILGDGADADNLPDFVPKAGTGRIVCNAPITRNTALGRRETYFPEPILFNIDATGAISQGGRPYVMVLAPSPGIEPAAFNYEVSFDFADGTWYGPFSFNVIPGGEVDLAEVLPVPASSGILTARNPITVSATAPANPVEGDLWFDIS